VTVAEELVPCTACSGAGWIRTGFYQEEVCKACKGMRETVAETKSPCKVCSGKSYVVHLMQKFNGKVPCSECDGTGRCSCFECGGRHLQECERCSGTGVEEEYQDQHRRLEMCSSCGGKGWALAESPKRLLIREWWGLDLSGSVDAHFGRSCLQEMSESDRLILTGGEEVMVTRCKKCFDQPIGTSCRLCNETRVQWVLLFEKVVCAPCRGEGFDFLPPICEDCDGAGKIACDVCDSNGKVECCDCDGTGLVDGVVERKV
jgi:hypothetical protein